MDYKEVYSELYRRGYRGGKKFTGNTWAKITTLICQYQTVLDVGCARGDGCRYFITAGKQPKGCDVAEIAVKATKALGIDTQLASATQLPYATGEFDMVFSSDVVEHLVEDDVPSAIDEMVRVSREWVSLQIACSKSKHTAQAQEVGLTNFHLTIWNHDKWRTFFEQRRDSTIAYFAWNNKYTMVLLRKKEDRCLESQS